MNNSGFCLGAKTGSSEGSAGSLDVLVAICYKVLQPWPSQARQPLSSPPARRARSGAPFFIRGDLARHSAASFAFPLPRSGAVTVSLSRRAKP